MKVNAWKNIDVECEVDVSLDDCISELLGIADEDGMPRRKLQAIDGATRILERITPEMVESKLSPGAVSSIRERLQKWMERV
jgi:hypothetical protein